MKLELPKGVSILENEIDSIHPGRTLSLPDKRQRGSSLRPLKQSNSLICQESAVSRSFQFKENQDFSLLSIVRFRRSLKVSKTISTREQMKLNRNFK